MTNKILTLLLCGSLAFLAPNALADNQALRIDASGKVIDRAVVIKTYFGGEVPKLNPKGYFDTNSVAYSQVYSKGVNTSNSYFKNHQNNAHIGATYMTAYVNDVFNIASNIAKAQGKVLDTNVEIPFSLDHDSLFNNHMLITLSLAREKKNSTSNVTASKKTYGSTEDEQDSAHANKLSRQESIDLVLSIFELAKINDYLASTYLPQFEKQDKALYKKVVNALNLKSEFDYELQLGKGINFYNHNESKLKDAQATYEEFVKLAQQKAQ